MGLNLMEEIKKAAEGKPSRVILTPMTEEEIAVEEKIRQKGYRFAFGNGMTRAELADWLPDISAAQ